MRAPARRSNAIRRCVAAAASAVALAAGVPGAVADGLADRHAARSGSCRSCHRENPPSKPVVSKVCEGCHGDNDAVAKRTAGDRHNPHFNHLGDVACLECHHGHRPSEYLCDSCHQFGVKVP